MKKKNIENNKWMKGILFRILFKWFCWLYLLKLKYLKIDLVDWIKMVFKRYIYIRNLI